MGPLLAIYITRVSPKIAMYALAAVLAFGGVFYYRHTVIVARDAYWNARIAAAAKRVADEINVERRASAERTAVLNKHITDLQTEIDNNETIIDAAPDATDNGLSIDSVRRLNRVR